MNIAFISYHTCPLAHQEGKETGGMNVYVYELAKELARMGHHVDVFTRSQDEHTEKIVDVEPRFRVIHVVSGPEQPIPKKELGPYIAEFVGGFHEYCSKNAVRYDIVHAHYYLSGIIARQLRQSSEQFVPLILSFHTLALMKNLVARDEGEKEERIRIEEEMTLAQEADRIISPSESDADYLQYLYGVSPEKITIIPPGVDPSVFHPIDRKEAKEKIGMPLDAKLILFVGRIEPLKGIDVLMYAVKIISKRNPDIPVKLCIVGGDISKHPTTWSKTLKSLENVRQTLRLTASVTFVGQQSQDILPYYYNAAEMVVMPSHYESFGMAALEAMSCGIPVITTNVAGISSLIDKKHESLVTTVNNPLLLACQIEELLKNPKKREEIGISVREQVADLSWSAIAGRMIEVYTSFVKTT